MDIALYNPPLLYDSAVSIENRSLSYIDQIVDFMQRYLIIWNVFYSIKTFT